MPAAEAVLYERRSIGAFSDRKVGSMPQPGNEGGPLYIVPAGREGEGLFSEGGCSQSQVQ